MSWSTVIWSMCAAACLTLAGQHLMVWSKHRRGWDHLAFVSSALAAAVVAGFELALMHATTTAGYGELMRWGHVPFTVLIISILWFVRLYLRAGRLWLAWLVCGLRTLAMALNFCFQPNLNFREITSLRQVHLLGDSVSVAVGVTNPWSLIGQLSLLLLLIFYVDATIAVWRRGDRRLALVIGGSAGFFISFSLIHTVLVVWGVIHTPFFFSLAYLGIVLVMGYELSSGVLRTAKLAQQLQATEAELRENEQRMALAAETAHLCFWVRDLAHTEIWGSDTGRAMYGFAKSDPVDHERVLQRIHPDDREAVHQA